MKTINHIFFFFFLLVSCMAVSAQSQTTIRDLFRQMPDSILPYLTENNRLDMIDFIDSKMKARVQNKFDGYSELLFLSDDSLSLQMSPVLRLTMRLLPTEQAYDEARQIICLDWYVGHPSSTVDVRHTFYTVLWRKLEDYSLGLVKKD